MVGSFVAHLILLKSIFFKDVYGIINMIHTDRSSLLRNQILIARSVSDGTATINDQRLRRKYINEAGLVETDDRTEFNSKGDLLAAVKQYASWSTYQAVETYIADKTI